MSAVSANIVILRLDELDARHKGLAIEAVLSEYETTDHEWQRHLRELAKLLRDTPGELCF